MKNIFKILLMAVTCCLLLNSYISKINASNWLQVYEDDSFIIYLDGDSFSPVDDKPILSFWQKQINKKDGDEFKSYQFINLKDRTSAIKTTVRYPANAAPSTYNEPYLDYQPVIPDSIGEVVYKMCEYVAILPQTGLKWDFKNVTVPKHSQPQSNNWVKDKSSLSIAGVPLTYDKTTYSYNKSTGIEAFWSKEKGVLNGKECDNLTYCLHNKKTDKYAFVGVENIVNGVSYNRYDLPILIWHDSKSLYNGAEEKELSIQLFLYQLSLIAKANI